MKKKTSQTVKFYLLILFFIGMCGVCIVLPFIPLEKFQPFLRSQTPDNIIIGKQVKKILACLTVILMAFSLGWEVIKMHRKLRKKL